MRIDTSHTTRRGCFTVHHKNALTEGEITSVQAGLPDADFSLHIGARKGTTEEFFAPTEANADILRERRELLTAHPERHSVLLPEGEETVEELRRLLNAPLQERTPHDTLRKMSSELEPDILLLKRDTHQALRLVGGSVCFPSAWSPEEKMGMTLEEIHNVVPGLNAAIGTRIQKFLTGIRPGNAWLRSNWGLSRMPDRNQHSKLSLPKLDESATPDDTYFRMEHQALIPLPQTEALLFGIRIEVHRLTDLIAHPDLRRAFIRQYSTMPDDIATYKSIARSRTSLLNELGYSHM